MSRSVTLYTVKTVWLVQIECSATGLCPGTTALTLTTVTAPVISLINGTYLSSVVEVKQVSLLGDYAPLHCFLCLPCSQASVSECHQR